MSLGVSDQGLSDQGVCVLGGKCPGEVISCHRRGSWQLQVNSNYLFINHRAQLQMNLYSSLCVILYNVFLYIIRRYYVLKR